MAKVGASAILRVEDLPNFPPEWEPLLRQINQGQGGLQNAVNGGLTLDDNLSLERVTVNLSHGVPQLVRLKKLASAAGVIVLGVAGSGASNYALAIPIVLTSTSTPNQVKLTAYFTDSTATRVKVSVLLFKEGVSSSAAPAAPSAGGGGTVFASYFRSAGAGAQNIANSTLTVINFDGMEVDAAATVTTGAAWHFKAPKAGVYTVKAAVLLGPTTPDVTLLLLALYQNGVEARRFYYETIAGAGVRIANGTSASGACDVVCAVNDLLDVRMLQVNDSASTYPTNTRAPYVYATIYGPLP